MRHAIVEKLDSALRKRITSEQQVVYVMVELRKLLELDEIKDRFEALIFHCDWVVHPRLTGKTASKVLDAFNENARHDGSRHPVSGIVGLDNFMSDLTTVLLKYQLPTSLTQNPTQWNAFLRNYGEVVRDCPLLCRDQNKEFIDEISIEFSKLTRESTRASGFVIQVRWKWQNKKTGREEYAQMFF